MSRRLAIPETLREMQAKASDPEVVRLGVGKRGQRQDACPDAAGAASPAQRRAAGADSGPDFHQGGGRQYGDRDLQHARRVDKPQRRSAGEGDHRLRRTKAWSAEPDFARQLFARTIETPGGLRIQTLHAFCERLLRLFPFEANVPAHFRVIDERETRRAAGEARDARSRARALVDSAAALELRGARGGRLQIRRTASGGARFRRNLRAPSTTLRPSRRRCGARWASPGETAAVVEAEMLGGDIGRKRRQAWAQRARRRQENRSRVRGEASRRLTVTARREARIEALLEAFFTRGGRGRAMQGRTDDQGAARRLSRPRSRSASRAGPLDRAART